ncbi:class I SAM-dependent methyltransferase [Nucisporomicrobium flavum]|jgi:2-polyprenyl-3-methyl-5-hydroxy-6-metoxy-1,4-benzoquinol methylase|uniref:class I SAM-dependent methyltransferase n=1 Tax=Nucisporomicrobium flavum TaxID=2785915 RepID=UPI0018F350DF|nr:class I SAM-dependent methyltransferase [Nucisporomicrobium flavum]
MTDTAPARITIGQLHDVARGYVKTALLRTALELRLFDLLADQVNDPKTIAGKVGADPRGIRILLDGLAGIGLVSSGGGDGYALLPGSEDLLVSTGAHYFGNAMKLSASDWEWDAQKNLIDAVRHGGTVTETHALTPQFDFWEDFAEHTSWFNNGAADLMAEQLVPWAAYRDTVEVLDVACSHGSYGFSFARREPRARITGLDWPNVLEVTARNAERLGLSDRVEFIAGDMFTTPLGGPYDIVMLTNVLHHFSEERATELLKRIRTAVKPGGRIAVVGHTFDEHDTPETNPLPYMFSLIMLVQTPDGETHSVATYQRMLEAAGFTDFQTHSGEKAMHRLFLAERPAEEPGQAAG